MTAGLTLLICAADHLSARPLGTELTVDPEDFDRYEVVDDPIITVNLKELKVRSPSWLA